MGYILLLLFISTDLMTLPNSDSLSLSSGLADEVSVLTFGTKKLCFCVLIVLSLLSWTKFCSKVQFLIEAACGLILDNNYGLSLEI